MAEIKGKKKLASGTAVLPCNCTSAYQDQKYGQGRRVHNAATGSKNGDWRCTVCGRTH
jgi:hypothetical protein